MKEEGTLDIASLHDLKEGRSGQSEASGGGSVISIVLALNSNKAEHRVLLVRERKRVPTSKMFRLYCGSHAPG